MTVFINTYHITRAVAPLFIDHPKYRDPNGQLDPVEFVPDNETRLVVVLDIALPTHHPDMLGLIALAKQLVEASDRAEAKPAPAVDPHVVVGLVPVDEETPTNG